MTKVNNGSGAWTGDGTVPVPPVSVLAWNGSAYVQDVDVQVFLGPASQNPKTASGGRDQVDDIWITTDSTQSLGGLVAAAVAKRTSSDIAIASATWVDVDTGLDLVLAGVQSGDWIGVNLSARIDSEAVELYVDCCSVVSGSPVNYWGQAGGASERGVQAWTGVLSRVNQQGGTIWKRAVAGDIATDGSVTVRLRARGSTSGTKTINASTNIPLQFQATAHRPVPGTGLAIAGQIIGETIYSPGTQQVVSTTSGTMSDVDATNLAVTFVVPASGNVTVELEATVSGAASTDMAWGVREGSSMVTATYLQGGAIATRILVSMKITGLTPTVTKTYKFGHFRSTGSGTPSTVYGNTGSGTPNPARITVIAGF